MKKAKQCLIALLSGALLAITVLSGCGQSQKAVSKNDDHLTVYLWENRLMKNIVPYIHEQFPDQDIEFITGNNDTDLYSYFEEHGELPDIITVRRFSGKDAQDLEPYLMDFASYDVVSRYYSYALQYYKNSKDEIQWLPICGMPQTIIANKTLFEQYGIKIPKNYKEYAQACQQFYDNGIKPYSLDLAEDWSAHEVIQTGAIGEFMSLDGIEWRSGAETSSREVKFDDGLWKRIFSETSRFLKDSHLGKDDILVNADIAYQTFVEGKAAMFHGYPALMQQLQMNQIASMDRAIFIRNLLGLPQTLGTLLMALQNKNIPLSNTSLILNDLNEELLKNQKMLSQIFDETSEIPLNVTQNIAGQTAAAQKDAVMLFFSGMIQMPAISEIILKNSKQAVANLILAMASASKNNMTNDQIRDTLSILNSCIAMAESNNPSQTLKSLMLLYLPWLPLNEGVGFDLEVTPPEGENESNDSKLTVLIQTRNFGNVKGVFTLTTSNSVDIYILCTEDFPKKTLQKSLMEESSSHAMNTTIDIEAVEPKKKETFEEPEAKVNLSATNEMNPYLLLMAHAFIRNTIFIDSNAIVEEPNS